MQGLEISKNDKNQHFIQTLYTNRAKSRAPVSKLTENCLLDSYLNKVLRITCTKVTFFPVLHFIDMHFLLFPFFFVTTSKKYGHPCQLDIKSVQEHILFKSILQHYTLK
jgi:hypothetical protein